MSSERQPFLDSSPELVQSVQEAGSSVRPVEESNRLRGIDVLRGFALLGILPVNMIAFSHILAAYMNPRVAGGFTGIDFVVWCLTHFVFELKMITIFTTLFGVGLFIQVDRAEQRRGRVGAARGLFFRRVGWLLLFGLAHAYLFWYGDILTYYALVGMLVYWFRRWRPRTLGIVGMVLLVLGGALVFGMTVMIGYVQAHQDEPEFVQIVRQMKEGSHPSPEFIAQKEKEVRDASFLELVALRAPFTLGFQFQTFIIFIFRFTGLMLLGIAIYKIGGFSLQWSRRAYFRWMTIGLGIGSLIVAVGTWQHAQATNDMTHTLRVLAFYDYTGSLFMAAGYFGLIMLMVKENWLPALQHRLAAVGQMAFTNYLMHTLICTAIFHGWGFAQFGLWPRSAQFVLVLTIWLLQLTLSPIWLRHFHFGPCEWLWRSLTYLRLQPFRKSDQGNLA